MTQLLSGHVMNITTAEGLLWVVGRKTITSVPAMICINAYGTKCASLRDPISISTAGTKCWDHDQVTGENHPGNLVLLVVMFALQSLWNKIW